jgi:hypothetical protein
VEVLTILTISLSMLGRKIHDASQPSSLRDPLWGEWEDSRGADVVLFAILICLQSSRALTPSSYLVTEVIMDLPTLPEQMDIFQKHFILTLESPNLRVTREGAGVHFLGTFFFAV